jgi:hypothetical protein
MHIPARRFATQFRREPASPGIAVSAFIKVAVHSVKLALHDFNEYGIKGEWTMLSN